jgi:hypothetical protein
MNLVNGDWNYPMLLKSPKLNSWVAAPEPFTTTWLPMSESWQLNWLSEHCSCTMLLVMVQFSIDELLPMEVCGPITQFFKDTFSPMKQGS